MEPEHGYNNTIKEEIPKQNKIEIKEEFPKDPFAILETFNNAEAIRDIVKEDKMESNTSFPIEIKEEFPNDPLASLETSNNCKNISVMLYAENVDSNNCSVPIAEKTLNFKCKLCNEAFSTKNKLSWHISQVHNSYPPIKEEILEESENEIEEEFPKDPFALLETFANSEGASDTEHDENKGNRAFYKNNSLPAQ